MCLSVFTPKYNFIVILMNVIFFMIIESNIRAHVLLYFYQNSLQPSFYLFSLNLLINSIIHDHSYKLLFSNIPRLYSKWLNSVIYWLIITARTRHGRVGRHSIASFYFYDVIYHIRHCNVDNRRRNVVFATIGR